jgi:hypothetical protein
MLRGAVPFSFQLQGHRDRVMNLAGVRFKGQRPLVMRDRGVNRALILEHVREVRMRFGRFGVNRQPAPARSNRRRRRFDRLRERSLLKSAENRHGAG